MISFVIPYYNAPKQLKKCLKSILKIKNIKYEVIIVDDGSNGSLTNLIDLYVRGNKNIKIISIEHSGVSTARNVGILASSGEYICFVDSDDIIDSNFFDNYYKEMDSDFDLLVTNILINNHKENIITKGKITTEQFVREYYPLYRKHIIHLLHGKIFRRNILLKNKIFFRKNVSIGEDLIFNLKFLKYINDVFVSNKIFYNYATSDNSVTLKYNPNALEDNLRMFFSIKNIFNVYRLNYDYLRIIALKMSYSLIMNIMMNDSFSKKINQVKKIRKLIKKFNILSVYKSTSFGCYILLYFMLLKCPNIIFYFFVKAIFYLKKIRR